LLDRGPAPVPSRTVVQRVRRRLRAAVLRALRPYSVYQYEVNVALVRSLEFQRDQIAHLESFVQDLIASADALRRRIAEVESYGAREPALVRELRAVPYMAGDPFEVFSSPVGEVTGFRSSLAQGECGSPYACFEEVFRGPAERVTELQRPYVALVADHQPVLDVGCGRGELLVLLAAEGIEARGLDTDAGMIARCRAQGLDVTQAEATEYLDGVDDGSLGTLFCAQVIEHLDADALWRLLELARRKLKPTGLFIAETVNPHSVAALKTFWVDRTHRAPVFPEVALTMCGCAGFASAYVFAPGHTSFEKARFEATAYAVVATQGDPRA
jgi:SAM-dependent methyltransferase